MSDHQLSGCKLCLIVLILMFAYLKICLAHVAHNFKLVEKYSYVLRCFIWDQT